MKTKRIVLAGLIVALSIVIPLVMPKITIGPTTVTLASHVPIIFAMFVDPFVAIMAVICSSAAFYIAFPPIVALRAFSHIVFVSCGIFMRKQNLYLLLFVTMILHALLEVLVYFAFGSLVLSADVMAAFTPSVIVIYVGGITAVHHCVDFAITMAVLKPLRTLKFLDK